MTTAGYHTLQEIAEMIKKRPNRLRGVQGIHVEDLL